LDGDLEQLSRGPIYTGETGTLALDILKKVENFITEYRENVKELLERDPHKIPHYRLETQNRRSLSRDAVKVYEALAQEFPDLKAKEFLRATTPTLGGLTHLFETYEAMAPEEISYTLEHTLGDRKLLQHEIVNRLVRDKEG
jgi:hypothetical protein